MGIAWGRRPVWPLVAALALAGCSLRSVAVRKLGAALAGSAGVYAADDDPELVGAALPFALKTIEGLLAEEPRDPNLLLAAASGFTQYAYAFVEQPADFAEADDLAGATELRQRAVKLYRRARDYGWRALELDFPSLRAQLSAHPDQAATVLAGLKMENRHVPLLYWTAAPTAAAISLAKQDAELTADLPLVEAMMRRALALEEGFGAGALHEFFIAYEGGRGSVGGSLEAAREHLRRALELGGGKRASPLVAFAGTVSVATQDRGEFEKLLNQALAIDPEALPEERLANVVAQRRARWLLGRADELFIE
jgi:predicted anti-sigma-YlaC factor YlaD